MRKPHECTAHAFSGFRPAPTGRMRHEPRALLARHCHREPFAAVLLSGGYCEAGDRGRVKVQAGDVVLHGPYESHLDSVGVVGAEVLVLPWSAECTRPHVGRVDDPDLVVRIAERDPLEAARCMAEHLRPIAATQSDWPDRLARDLGNDPNLSIHAWADRMGLARKSVPRGFRRVYGVAPATFRARMRALRALALIGRGETLAGVASACGFADQAHMSRSIRHLTGYAPKAWRQTQIA